MKETKTCSSLTPDGTTSSHQNHFAVQKTTLQKPFNDSNVRVSSWWEKALQISHFPSSGTCCLSARYRGQCIREAYGMGKALLE